MQVVHRHCSDLLAQVLKQGIGEVLHHHRLQRKTDSLSPLDQGPSREGFQRLQHPSARRPLDQQGEQRIERRPLADHRQPGEQCLLQRRQACHLLAQYHADAIEDQLPRLQERDDLAGKEIDDSLSHDLERQRIARIAGDQLQPGGGCPAQVLVFQQGACCLLGEAHQAQGTDWPAQPFQGLDLAGFLAAGQHHTALVGGFTKPLDQSSVALVAGTVVALGVFHLEERLQIVQDEQAAPLLQASDQLVDALFQRGGELGGWGFREEGEAVGDQVLTGGGIPDGAPQHGVELGGKLLAKERDQRALADAAHPQDGHEPATLVRNEVDQFGQLSLTTREAAHIQRSDPVNARESC